MVRINLLPHREEKRKQRKAAFVALLLLSALIGVGIVLLVGGYNARAIAVQEQRNAVLQTAITALDGKIARIATLKQEIEALKARQQAVEDLQGDRNQPVYLLDELVRQTPEGVYLKGFRQDGQRVTVDGYAQSQERVSELLRNLSSASPWLERPDLIEVKAGVIGQAKNPRKVVEFSLVVGIKRPRDKEGNDADGNEADGGTGTPAAAKAG
ncbi:PilN domain-containing protein [Pseudoduganella sp. SL102]|uniref:PilN domain-containing protein n=1 Tax=Pseudoduganella sp. SL102 TaxID=2995154 RepID=UPI00248BEA70|nr:PilN domain-containing protein [Pseudoduganella sp. SL102]WBS03459.1 PilN domain-containing protein [Pseudoduganella sp. SL102]